MESGPPIDPHLQRWYGVEFDIPLPLVLLGGHFGIQVVASDATIRVDLYQHSYPPGLQHRLQNVTVSAGALPRDRFGLLGYTHVLMRVRTTLALLFADEILKPLQVDSERRGVLIVAGENLRLWCCDCVNRIIDAYSVTNSQFWVPNITPADMWKIKLMQWDAEPEGEGRMLTFGIGIPGHQVELGPVEARPTQNMDRLLERIKLPWRPWEKLMLQARRYAEVCDYVASGLSMCLAFEVFINQLLYEKRAVIPVAVEEDAGLNRKCTEYLQHVIGGSLENAVHGENVRKFARVRSLRNTIMHRGTTEYSWRTPGGVTGGPVDINDPAACREHLEMISALIEYIQHRA